MSAREPIFNAPAAVLAVLVLMAVIHAGRTLLLSPESDAWLVYALAFIPARYAGLASELPGGELASFTSPVTHMLVHGDIMHLAFNSAWLLAFGSAICQRTGSGRFIAFALFTGIVGAFTFLAFNPEIDAPVVGASGAVAGLMGGTMRFLFSAMDMGGVRLLRDAPRMVPLMPLTRALRDRRVLIVSAIFVLVNLLAWVGLGGDMAPGGIAWEAHVGGYFAGLLAFGHFDAPATTALQPTSD